MEYLPCSLSFPPHHPHAINFFAYLCNGYCGIVPARQAIVTYEKYEASWLSQSCDEYSLHIYKSSKNKSQKLLLYNLRPAALILKAGC